MGVFSHSLPPCSSVCRVVMVGMEFACLHAVQRVFQHALHGLAPHGARQQAQRATQQAEAMAMGGRFSPSMYSMALSTTAPQWLSSGGMASPLGGGLFVSVMSRLLFTFPLICTAMAALTSAAGT